MGPLMNSARAQEKKALYPKCTSCREVMSVRYPRHLRPLNNFNFLALRKAKSPSTKRSSECSCASVSSLAL